MKLSGIVKKPLIKKIALWSVALFVLFGVLGFLVAPHFVKSALEKSISEKLHRTATIRELGINPYALSATIKGFALKDKNGVDAALAFDELYVNVEAASLLRFAPVIGKIKLSGPHLNLVRNTDLSYNFTDVIEEFINQPDTGSKSLFSISRIQISGGRIEFDDKPMSKRHAVTDIELHVPFVSNLPSQTDMDMQPSFRARVNGTPLAFTGQMRLFKEVPVASIELNISDLDMQKYFAYIPVPLDFKLPSGTLDSKLTVNFSRPKTDQIELTVAGTLALKKVELVDRAGQALLKWNALNLAIHSLDILHGKLALDSVMLLQPEAVVRRDKNGTLNLLALQPSAAAKKGHDKQGAKPIDKVSAAAKAEKSATPFEFSAAEIKLVGGEVDFSDAVPKKPFHTHINDINLMLLKLASNSKEAARVELTLNADNGASLQHHGQLMLSPLSAQGELGLSALKLKSYAPYYAPFVRFEVEDGALNAAMKYSVAMKEGKLQANVSDMTLGLAALKLRQENEKISFFTLAQLDVKGAALDLDKREVAVGELATHDGKLNARRDKAGVFNLTQLLAAESGTQAVSGRDAGAPWNAVLKKLSVNNYAVHVEDEKVADSVPFDAKIISLNADNLSLSKGAKTKLALKAALGRRGKLDVSGTLAATPLQARLKIDLKSVDLVPLQSYFTALLSG